MRGASALNGLLAEFPGARLDVQIVWEPVLKTDIAPPLSRVLALIPDERVKQYWDPGRVLSEDMVRSVNDDPKRYGFEERLPDDFIAWDLVAVFEKSARWDRDLPIPLHYDGPVVQSIDRTRKSIAEALARTRDGLE